VAQVGRISGPLLQADLLRNGNNLAFRNDLNTTQLLLLDVNNNRIGVNNATPSFELDVLGTTQTTNLITNNATTPGFGISNSTFSAIGDISLNAANAIVMANMENGTIRISDNIISTIDSNADIDLRPWQEYVIEEGDPYLQELQDGLLDASRGIGNAFWQTVLPSGFQRGDLNEDGIINIDDVFAFLSVRRGLTTSGSRYDLAVAAIKASLPTTEIINDLNVYGNIHTPGNITFEGTITLGDQDTDDVTFNSDINSDIIPDQSNQFNLGSEEKQWHYLYTNLVNGQFARTDELNVGLVNIKLRYGGTLYVAVEGNDANSGDHMLSPFATIARALQAAEASGTQPVTIKVSPGEYQEALPLVVPNNVTIIGSDIRNTVIMPDTSSQSEDVFHLNDNTTISDITIKNFYYDNVNNTGYAFRLAPGAVLTERSPYIQNITVLTNETTPNVTNDAGRGAWIDGSEVNALSTNKTMLFHSCTFISPNADVINMTNDVRVEWLNSFTYYANRGLYAFNGVDGGAELRSIGSANIYGNYGTVADGADTLMYLIQHNFAYIGAGTDNTNDLDLVIQANEVVELNSGQIHYVSTDQVGNFRVGDNFFVDLETGNTSLNIDTASIDTITGMVINSVGGTTVLDGSYISTGDILITNNTISTNVGDLNLQGATGTININNNTNVSGNLDIIDNFSFGGTLNIAGDQPGRDTAADRLVFNVQFEQDFNPHQHLTHSLGEVQRPWLNSWLSKLEVGDITFDGNVLTTDVSSANLELRASGTGLIYVPSNNVNITNNLTVSGVTNLQAASFAGAFSNVGTFDQTGNRTATNFNITGNVDVTRSAQFEEILIDDNFITTTTSNADLELRAAGTGKVLIPNNNVNIVNNLSTDNITVSNINNTLQTAFNQANINDLTITQNYITTTISNADLELRASGTGTVHAESSVDITNNLTVAGTTRFEDDTTNYEYGPELVVNGTFDNNVNGWSQTGGGSANDVNGNLQINATGAARNVSQEIIVEAGKTYDFEAQFRSVSNGNPFYLRIFESGVGTLFEWNETSGLVPDQLLTASFVPQTTAIDIIFRAVNTVVEWDNVSMFEDIGNVTTFTPVEVDITTTISHTGNTVQTGDVDQTGNVDIDGNLTVSNEFTTSHFNINNNVIQNYREDLRLNPAYISDTESIPGIIDLIINGTLGPIGNYAQTEQNLINFLQNNNYVDVNQSGTLTSSDRLAWLQYIANGSSNDDTVDVFLHNAVEQLLEDEFANPGKYNNNIFLGDYYRADLTLTASGTGRVIIPNNDVRVAQDLFTASINTTDITVTRDLELNEIVITDSIIEIDDNFISTTISNANLELRAEGNVIVPLNDVTITNNLTVDGTSNLKNTSITGDITHTGTRNQIGDLAVTGTVTVSTSNIKSEIQFDDIIFNDNYIETTNSNADLELRANGVGILTIPSNDVRFKNNVTLGTLNASTINIDNALEADSFELSSDIKIFDNVITTTNTNSNLELRTVDSSVRFEGIYFKDNEIRTSVADIDINATNNVNINSNTALKIPVGTFAQRQESTNNIRFNTTDNLFEAFNNGNTITFNGIYSDNRRTSVTAHPTNDNINFTVNDILVGTVDSNSLNIHGLDVDDILIQNNSIKTTLSNSDLELRANGTGILRIDDIDISNNVIHHTNNGALAIANRGYGKIKFADTNAVRLPAGSDAERPPFVPEVGMMRWNTDDTILETWDGNTFVTAAGSAATISADEMDDLILEYTLIFG